MTEPGSFGITPRWVLRAEISERARLLYGLLADAGDHSTLKAAPSRRALADWLHVADVKAVDRALSELEKIGALRIVPRQNPITRASLTNGYQLYRTPYGTNGQVVGGEAPEPPGGGQESPPPGGSRAPRGGAVEPPPVPPAQTPKTRSSGGGGTGTPRRGAQEPHQEPEKGIKGGRKGTRLWEPFELPAGWRTYARTKGFTDTQIDRIAEDFADYWHAKAGQGAIKLDWLLTWRTWVRRDADSRQDPSPHATGGRQTWRQNQ